MKIDKDHLNCLQSFIGEKVFFHADLIDLEIKKPTITIGEIREISIKKDSNEFQVYCPAHGSQKYISVSRCFRDEGEAEMHYYDKCIEIFESCIGKLKELRMKSVVNVE